MEYYLLFLREYLLDELEDEYNSDDQSAFEVASLEGQEQLVNEILEKFKNS